MANNVAKSDESVPAIESVRRQLELMAPEFSKVLPQHLPVDRLLRIAMTTARNTPKLLDCDRTSLFSAIMTCAQLGLEPDGVLGQAYLIPYGNKVQLVVGYKGLISLARNSGDVMNISAHEVREKDHFKFSFGLNEILEHTPARGDRGDITHFYAVARFKSGGAHMDVRTVEEVEATRDASNGYKSALRYAKRDKEGNITSINSPWHDHFVEMGKKTAIRAIAKYLPMSVQRAVALQDANDRGQTAHVDRFGDVTVDAEYAEPAPQVQLEKSGSKLDNLEKEISGDDSDDSDDSAGPDDSAVLAAGRKAASAGSDALSYHLDNVTLAQRATLDKNIKELKTSAEEADALKGK